MRTSRFIAAIAVSAVLLGASSVAADDGDPLILGKENDNDTVTTVSGPIDFNSATANTLTVHGSLQAPGINLGSFGVTMTESDAAGVFVVPEGRRRMQFRRQSEGGERYKQFLFLQVVGQHPAYRASYKQRTIPLERDAEFDSRITIFLNKPAPAGGLKVAYWAVGERPLP